MKEAITSPIAKNNIDTVKKTDKSQAYNKTVDTYRSNKYDKGKPLDKSRSTQITDTENTVNKENKSRYISRTSICNKSTKIEKPSEIYICNDYLIISIFLST